VVLCVRTCGGSTPNTEEQPATASTRTTRVRCMLLPQQREGVRSRGAHGEEIVSRGLV
jgi:hypothetical protein